MAPPSAAASTSREMRWLWATSARTPVIALDGPGVRDVVNQANGRLLPSDAPEEAFAAELACVTRDRESLRQLGESARRSVRDYDLAVCAERLLALYDQLCEQ